MKRWLFVSLGLTFVVGACRNPRPTAPTTDGPEETHAVRRPLADYLPAPGFQWLVQIKPAELAADPAWQSVFARISSKRRLDAFVMSTGMDPIQLQEIWWAGYELGHLSLFDGSKMGAAITARTLERARSHESVPTKMDDLEHFKLVSSEGPAAIVRLRDHMVAYAQGDVTLATIVRAYAEGRLSAPSALQLRQFAPLRDFDTDAPIRMFARGPFPDAKDLFVQGFAEGVISLRMKDSQLVVRGQARGLWDEEVLGQPPEQWVERLLQRPELRALGWSDPVEPLDVQCTSLSGEGELSLSECHLSGRWDAMTLAQRLRGVLIAELSELFPPEKEPATEQKEPATEGETGEK